MDRRTFIATIAEQPTKFELVINLTIPQSRLVRADKVIR